MRASRPYTYLGTVQGMCRECRALVPARLLEEDGVVYQERLCPTCGPARVRIADGVGWFLDRLLAGEGDLRRLGGVKLGQEAIEPIEIPFRQQMPRQPFLNLSQGFE